MYRYAILPALAISLLVLAFPEARSDSGTRLYPRNLKQLNTAADEDDPCPYDGGRVHRLYYASNGPGRFTLMVSKRDKNGQWLPGEEVQGQDNTVDNRSPCLTLDGHDLYFAVKDIVKAPNKDDQPMANFDIVHATNLGDPGRFTQGTPVQAICTAADELHPWVTTDGRELFFSRKTEQGWRVFVASRPQKGEPFLQPQLVKELAAGFQHATLTSDGGTMFLQGPLENNRWGLFRSKRAKKQGAWTPWSVPEALDVLNSLPGEAKTGDMSPCLSRDDRWLYFSSDRKGGKGGRDLWVIGAPSVISGVWKSKAKVQK